MDSEIYKIVIGKRAYEDVDDAITWYEAQAEGLGFEFLTRFNDVRAFLHKNPLIYQKVKSDFRRSKLSKFPYSVYFLVDEEVREVLVTAVWHNKRDLRSLEKRYPI